MKLRTFFCWLAVVCAVIFAMTFPADAAETGSCGEGVTWSFDAASETLTISGNGSITSAPWRRSQMQIQKVIFEKGITAITDGAFSGYYELKQIVFRGDKPKVGLTTFNKVTATAYWPRDNETWGEYGLTNHGGTLYWVAGEPGTTGVCGDDLQWSFQNGVLTISGTGPMYDYGTKSWMPWLDLRNEIIKVVIEPGVGSIGRAAFANCTELQQIKIGNDVESIGEQAFLYCGRLEAVSIPNKVSKIRELAFAYCTSLSRVVIPESVTEIYCDAFEGCRQIKRIFFYGNAPVISGMVSYDCFKNVEATAYYPVDDASWTKDVRDAYRSNITWVSNPCVNGHTETIRNAEKATCTKAGSTAGLYCSVCDEELVSSEIIPATGHKEAQDTAKAASCTETGLTAGKHCSVCGEVFVAQQTIPATGHSFGDWAEVKPATTAETGLAERTCTACGKKEQKQLEKLEPEPTQPTTVPTTNPTEPTTQPTEPTTKPTTSPTTEPTEPATQPSTAPPTKPTQPQTQPTTQPQTQPTTQPQTQPTTRPVTQHEGTLDAGTADRTPGNEQDSPAVVWVIVGLTAAAAVAAGGFIAFRKFRKK